MRDFTLSYDPIDEELVTMAAYALLNGAGTPHERYSADILADAGLMENHRLEVPHSLRGHACLHRH